MRETINIIATLLFRGIRNPPPTGFELILTAFVRILTLGFVIGVSIKNFLITDDLLRFFFILYIILGIPILYGMLEGQFAVIERHRRRSDPLSKLIVFNSVIVFSALVVAIFWLITIIW